MRSPHRTPLLALVLALSLIAAGCGDDGGSGSGRELSAADQEYVDAAMRSFDPEEDEPLTEDDARCIAEAMVGAVGAARLEELGVTPDDFASDDGDGFPDGLTEDEANDVVDGMDGCIDISGLFMQSMTEDESLSDEAKECLSDAFDDDFIRRIFVTMLTEGEEALNQDQELTSELLGVFAECPEALGDLEG